jgi:hypothetical protein
MQTYKGKYDWKQELRIGTLSKIRIPMQNSRK